MSMPAAQRHALLAAMSQTERRGVAFELRKQRAISKGQTPPTRGAGPYRARASAQAESDDVAASSQKLARIVGTIRYDVGNPTTTFGGGAIIGNRFNTAGGSPVLASGTVSTVQAVVVQGPAFTSSSAGFVIEGPQTAGGAAFAIFSSFTNPTGVTDTVTFNGIGANYTGNSFFVLFGDFATVHVPAFSTGSTLGQGRHGVVGYTGGMGPNITSTFDFGGAFNGLVRASGNILSAIVPVELMQFEVE